MTRLFHAAGHEVIGFDTGYFRDLVEDAPAACRPDAEIKGDIRDVDQFGLSRRRCRGRSGSPV